MTHNPKLYITRKPISSSSDRVRHYTKEQSKLTCKMRPKDCVSNPYQDEIDEK